MAGYSSVSRYTLVDGNRFADRKPEQAVRYRVHTSRERDSFDKLAAMYLGDPSRYWEIADINPHIEWPDRIPVGTPIRIPT